MSTPASNGPYSGWTPMIWVEAFLLLCVSPNVGVLALADFDLTSRALIDVDYLAVAAIVPFAPAWVVLLLYLAAIGADVLSTLSTRYAYPPVEMLWLVPQLFNLQIGWLVLLGGAVGLLVISRTLSRGRRRLAQASLRSWALPLLGIAVGAAALDLYGGTTFISQHTTWNLNIAKSGGLYVARLAGVRRRQMGGAPPAVASAAGPYVAAGSSASTEPWRGNIVLVLVESWGRFVRAADDSVLFEAFAGPEIRQRYEVRVGDVPFAGATSQGELRELCGLQMDFSAALHASQEMLRGCLPWRLRSMGYEAIALHGFRGSFYQRSAWYPKLGFQEMIFGRDPGLARDAHCGGVFRGVCDDEMVKKLGVELQRHRSGGPAFLFLVTLTSHLPVARSAAERSSLNCARLQSARGDDDVCALARVLDRVLEAVGRLAADPAYPPALYVVVGDHAPPFFGTSRQRLFDLREVPYVALLPR